jgi:hypothetical protein
MNRKMWRIMKSKAIVLEGIKEAEMVEKKINTVYSII